MPGVTVALLFAGELENGLLLVGCSDGRVRAGDEADEADPGLDDQDEETDDDDVVVDDDVDDDCLCRGLVGDGALVGLMLDFFAELCLLLLLLLAALGFSRPANDILGGSRSLKRMA